MKILAVAERAFVKGVPASELERFRAEWKTRWLNPGRRLRYMLALDSMKQGTKTRTRLETLLGLPPETKTINLLWPDGVSSTWDEQEARVSALTLMAYIGGTESGVERLVLLGRKVADAFRVPAEYPWGTSLKIGAGDEAWVPDERGPVLILPHPSGRSTVLNDLTLRAHLRGKVAEFLSGVAQTTGG